MNNTFVLVIFCAMVHSSGAFVAPERAVHDILDSTAFNVAMFAMGWAATRLTMKGSQWLKTLASRPLPILPSPSCFKSASQGADCAAILPPSSDAECGAAREEVQPDLLPSQDTEDMDSAPLLTGLSSILTSRISSIDSSLPPWRRVGSCFHSKECSKLSLADYVAFTFWYFECSAPCLVMALIYLNRLLARSPSVSFTSETSQRLFLTSLLMAAKFHDDETAPYPNHFYADVSSVGVEELNAMEKQFCKLIDWQFCVKQEEYLHYVDLMTAAAQTPSVS